MAFSSGYCLAKIKEYQGVISQIGSLSGGIDACGSYIGGADGISAHINNLRICGKTIDGGQVATISANVANIQGMLSPVVAECNQKIVFWEGLYQQALAREAEELERAKRSNRRYRMTK